MRCLRCGYCCTHYMVAIVDDPEPGPVLGNVVGHEGRGRCKHLVGDEPGKLSCAVHGRSWYSKTPCATHGQVEASSDDPCRMGEFVLAHLELMRVRLLLFYPPVPLSGEGLESLDRWGLEDPT
jgi:hypothetical protein